MARQRSGPSGVVALRRGPPGRLEMAQVAERLLQPPARSSRASARAPWTPGTASNAVIGPRSRSAPSRRSSRSATSARLASMCASTSANVRPWPGRQSRGAVRLDRVERAQELADRVGRVAVVVVERDAPEQVVAARSAARRSGWKRQTCDGAWPGVSSTSHAPRSLRTSTPGSSGRSASTGPAMPARRPRAAPLSHSRERLGRHAGRAGDLDALLEHGLGVLAPRASRARGSGASTPRSPSARRSSPPARSGRCARA